MSPPPPLADPTDDADYRASLLDILTAQLTKVRGALVEARHDAVHGSGKSWPQVNQLLKQETDLLVRVHELRQQQAEPEEEQSPEEILADLLSVIPELPDADIDAILKAIQKRRPSLRLVK